MAITARGIRAGRAFIELVLRENLEAGIRAAQRRLNQLANFTNKVGTAMFKVGAAGTAFAVPFVKLAGDAQESLSRFRAVFADQADAAEEWVQRTNAAIGRAKTELRDGLSSFQGFFLGLGFDSATARKMSTDLAQLSLDFASFNNLSDADAQNRFLSAMSGSSEVVAKYGINVKSAAIEQELLAMGIRKSASEVTEQEKALARFSIIARSMTAQGAVGDAVRTADSFANQLKRLKGQLRDTAETIGSQIIPVVLPLVQRLAEAATMTSVWAVNNGPLIQSLVKLVAIIAGVGAGLLVVSKITRTAAGALGFAAKGVGILAKVLMFLTNPIGIVIAIVGALAAVILTSTDVGREALGWLGKKFGWLSGLVKEIWGGISDAMKSGDLGAAAKIAWLGIKVAFLDGGRDIISWFSEMVTNLQILWANFTSGIQKGWLKATNWIVNAVKDVTTFTARHINAFTYSAGIIDSEEYINRDDILLDERRRDRQGRADSLRTRIDEINAERDASIVGYLDKEEARQRALDAAIEKANADFQALRAELRQKAADAAANLDEEVGGPGSVDFQQQIKNALASISLGQAAGNNISGVALGTFSASAIRGLSVGGSAADRTAKATEETAETTKRIDRKLDDVGDVQFL